MVFGKVLEGYAQPSRSLRVPFWPLRPQGAKYCQQNWCIESAAVVNEGFRLGTQVRIVDMWFVCTRGSPRSACHD